MIPNWWARWRSSRHRSMGHTQRRQGLPEVGGIQGIETICSCNKTWLEVY